MNASPDPSLPPPSGPLSSASPAPAPLSVSAAKSELARWTAFAGPRLLHRGAPLAVALAVQAALRADPNASVLTFDDGTGRLIDLDLRGGAEDIAARLNTAPQGARASADAAEAPQTAGAPDASDPGTADAPARTPGRPKLGVVAREVTLLPRHWNWLAAQPGGASVTLRKLVDTARTAGGARERIRHAQASADRFMMAMAGDLPGYEDAARALYAGQHDRFLALTEGWPADLRDHSRRLAGPAFEGSEQGQ